DGPGGHKGYEYSRTHNPTRQALERNLAALEGATDGICYASGCAATTAGLHLLKAGAHAIAAKGLCGGDLPLFVKGRRAVRLDFTYVDPAQTAAFAAAVRPNTKLVWVETPSNPLLKICDLAAVAEVCRRHKLILAVDNTFLSPALQMPLALGATLAVHST